jgi:catechol 1,2-dioxygenase
MTDQERLQEVAFAVVDAIQPVIREKQVTQDELHAAAAFLNRIGAAGFFPSLLDISFAMAVVDRERAGVPGTRSNLEGPEYRPGAPVRPDGSVLDRDPGPDAKLLTLRGRLTDAVTGDPIDGAELDFWQADEDGIYDRVTWHLRGIVQTGEDGSYTLQTVVPQDYSQHDGDVIGELLELMGRENYRAAHIHLKIHVDGETRFTTQFFHQFSPHLDSDYVVGAVSDDLIVNLRPAGTVDGRESYEGTFDIALAPATAAAPV